MKVINDPTINDTEKWSHQQLLLWHGLDTHELCWDKEKMLGDESKYKLYWDMKPCREYIDRFKVRV